MLLEHSSKIIKKEEKLNGKGVEIIVVLVEIIIGVIVVLYFGRKEKKKNMIDWTLGEYSAGYCSHKRGSPNPFGSLTYVIDSGFFIKFAAKLEKAEVAKMGWEDAAKGLNFDPVVALKDLSPRLGLDMRFIASIEKALGLTEAPRDLDDLFSLEAKIQKVIRSL